MTERTPKADFHVHYDPVSYEVSVETAKEAIDTANALNVRTIGLLARSQVVGHYNEFIRYGREKNVAVVPGIEHLTLLNGKKVDVICLGFDPNHPAIKERFGRGEKMKIARIAKLQKEFLENGGFSFGSLSEADEVLLETILNGYIVEKAIHLCEMVVSSEVNKTLLKDIKTNNMWKWRDIRRRYFGQPGYLGNERKQNGKFLYELLFSTGKPGFTHVVENLGGQVGNIKYVLEVIHDAGGVVLYSPEGKFNEDLWEDLDKLGIDGLMAWHGGRLGYNSEKIDIPRNVIKSARKSGLLILGGSDYQRKDWMIGNGDGDMSISGKRAVELRAYIQSKNNGIIPWEAVQV